MKLSFGYALNNWGLPLAIWVAPQSDLPICGYQKAMTITVGPFDFSLAWSPADQPQAKKAKTQ